MENKKRTLIGPTPGSTREETYTGEVHGKCSCGEPIIKVINSNLTRRGERFTYPGDNSAWDIFRCKSCKGVIEETFTPDKTAPDGTAHKD